jgi:hypothetical protein|tara:strand:+ start:1877 stop:1996 length:120 start_codon:yes stop_codon:yes gene_type:complete
MSLAFDEFGRPFIIIKVRGVVVATRRPRAPRFDVPAPSS